MKTDSLKITGKTRNCVLAALVGCIMLALGACSDKAEEKTTAPVSTAPKAVEPVSSPSVKDVVPAPEAKPAAPESTETPAQAQDKPGDVVFQDFTVRLQPVEAEMINLTILRDGTQLVADDGGYRTVKPGEAHEAFPREGCATMAVDLFTGGANCCFGSYIMTRCDGDAFLSFIEPYDGGLGQPHMLPDGKSMGYVIGDGYFMYYEPEGQKGDTPLSFSRVTSPRFQRFLVFENGLWRADKPGEFADEYRARAEKAKADKELEPSAKAITEAYYIMMSGDTAMAEEVFRAALPGQYAELRETIIADIKEAVEGFNPAEGISPAQ